MDDRQFDRVAQIVAAAQTRRGALRLLAAAAVGAVVPALAATDMAAKDKKKKGRRNRGGGGGTGGSPPSTPGTTKQLREVCNPSTDTCAGDLSCSSPTTRHSCSSSVPKQGTLCCVKPGGSCTECDCCGDNYCEFDNNNKPHCVPNPEG